MRRPAREPPPQPPPDLATRDPHLVHLAENEVLHRFFTIGFDPVFFDRGRDGRLNASDGSYGVLYTAKTAAGAFAETFLRTPDLIPADRLATKGYMPCPARCHRRSGAWRQALRHRASLVESPESPPQSR